MYHNLTTSSQVHLHSPPFFVPDCLHSLFLNCSAPLYYFQSTVRRFATLACSTIAIDLLSSLIKHCSNTYSHLNIHSTLLQYWGRSTTHQHWFAIGLRLGQKFFNVAFCSYLHHQYFNWAAVPGGRISNPPTSQSPIVSGKRAKTESLQ
jgi:hypothetical protein